MPEACFSYDLPRVIPGSGGVMGRSGGVMGPCFSYSVGLLPGDLRRTPEGTGCFSFAGDVPLGIGNHGIEPRPGRGIRRMPGGEMGPCFGCNW
jgi:hypothetical protein